MNQQKKNTVGELDDDKVEDAPVIPSENITSSTSPFKTFVSLSDDFVREMYDVTTNIAYIGDMDESQEPTAVLLG